MQIASNKQVNIILLLLVIKNDVFINALSMFKLVILFLQCLILSKKNYTFKTWIKNKINKIYLIMKTIFVFIGSICLLSTSVRAQTIEKKQAKVERKNVVLAKKAPVKLLKKQSINSKTNITKKEEKINTKKTVAIKPEK